MRRKETIIKVTHEFLEDPIGVSRAYDTWGLLLARSLNLGGTEPDQHHVPATKRRNKKGTA